MFSLWCFDFFPSLQFAHFFTGLYEIGFETVVSVRVSRLWRMDAIHSHASVLHPNRLLLPEFNLFQESIPFRQRHVTYFHNLSKTHVSCFLFQYHTLQASFLRWQMQWLWRHHCRNCSSSLVRPQFHAQVLCGCIQELPENRKRNTPHIHIPRNLWLFAHIKSSAFVYGC